MLATANPIEYEGTYPLPEAQLDRFLLRVSFGYPTVDEEHDVLRCAGWPADARRSTLDAGDRRRRRCSRCRRRSRPSRSTTASARYCVALATATRAHPHALVGASPRGSLALMLTARACAVVDGRDYVMPEDVKAVAEPVLVAPDHRSVPSSG